MPAAAAVPESMAVGTDQKHEVVDIIPVTATAKATSRAQPGRPGKPLAAKAKAAVRAERPT